MSKTGVIVGVLIIAGLGGVAYLAKDDISNMVSSLTKPESNASSKPEDIRDMVGEFRPFSDASITKHPADGAEFGNGQILTFEYSGAQSNKDPNAVIRYDLYYVTNDGAVVPLGGNQLDGQGSGVFTTPNSVYIRQANTNGKDGFIRLTVTRQTMRGGQVFRTYTKRLGVYPIKITAASQAQ